MFFGLISKNVDLGPALKISPWRKVAIGTWKSAADPSVYGMLEVDCDTAFAYIDRLSKKTEMKITLTHFVGAALARTIAKHPEINCILRFGRLYPRKNVDIFFQVASDSKGQDLSGMVVRDADKKSIVEIAETMNAKVARIKQKDDRDYAKMKGTMGLMPGWIVGKLMDWTGHFLYALNLWTPLFGVPKDSFGSAMITNIGSIGLDMAFAPLVPYSRVPLLLAVGAANRVPVFREDQVTSATRLKLCVTIDHRLIDGMHAAKMSKEVENIFNHPEQTFGPL